MPGTGYRTVLQTNANHCRAAQDLFCQALAEWLVDVAVVAEPYSVPGHWLGDRDGLVALATRSSTDSSPLSLLERGTGYVAAAWGEIAIIGVYFSPNRRLSEFEDFLESLMAAVNRLAPRQFAILGDLNAKSVAWGNLATQCNVRGPVLETWAVSAGLCLLNRGTVQTCVRQQGGSVVDVSFATPALAARIANWRVELVETLSDHRYIRFEVSTQHSQGAPRSGRSLFPRWALTRFNREAAKEAAFVQAWFAPPPGGQDPDAAASRMRESLTEVCNSSMPRSRRPPPRRAVYWWTVEIADLRATCVAARRAYTRSRRRRHRDPANEEVLYASYREAQRALKAAINAAKARARAELLEGLDRDPWGRPYRAARNKLRPIGPPLTETLEPSLLEGVVRVLFPGADDFVPPVMDPPTGAVPPPLLEDVPPVTVEEVRAVTIRLRAKKTAPGPDGVPARVVAVAVSQMEEQFRELFCACLSARRFPKLWKEGQLCLLRKEGRPADSPSAYRPIVLLDEVGKMFERIIASRLTGLLQTRGPDLSDAQFGFRTGRSTVDALTRLKGLVHGSVEVGDGVLAVSFDISNAFNSIPHSTILEALRFHGVPSNLQALLANYLEDRHVLFANRNGRFRRHRVESGVPQGSVLGPLLWNIGFDWLLRGALLRGTSVICYADDTLLTAQGRDFAEAARFASAGGTLVARRIRRLGLRVALEKTEAVFFHGARQRVPPDAHIVVEGVRIDVKTQMKYLGLTLDSRWRFGPHLSGLAQRLLRAAGAFSGLLPNLGGPRVKCRQLYAGILKSMALYGAPVWAVSLYRKENATVLRGPQRAIAQRVVRAYRTVSFQAACALAGTPPWELEAGVLARVYEWTAECRARGERPAPEEREAVRSEAKAVVVRRWADQLAHAPFGRRTLDVLGPALPSWLERPHGFLSYRLVQVLTGHGCFGHYLHRIGAEESPQCHGCGAADDTADHTLAGCPSWSVQRRTLVSEIGQDLSLPSVVNAMLGSDLSWAAVASFCEDVISQKEAAERERENDPLAAPLRRRRTGVRRRFRNRLPTPGGGQRVTGAGAPPPALHRPPPPPGGNGRVFPVIPAGTVGPAV